MREILQDFGVEVGRKLDYGGSKQPTIPRKDKVDYRAFVFGYGTKHIEGVQLLIGNSRYAL